MKRYKLNVEWLMLVPTTFSTEVVAESYEEAIKMAVDGANSFAISEWERKPDLSDNIYMGDDFKIQVTEVL